MGWTVWITKSSMYLPQILVQYMIQYKVVHRFDVIGALCFYFQGGLPSWLSTSWLLCTASRLIISIDQVHGFHEGHVSAARECLAHLGIVPPSNASLLPRSR